MKKNNKGFVLVETLVVTVFVMAVFSVIYISFYPLAGEYERREAYDDVDSKYGAYWMKYFIQSDSYDFYRSGGLNSSIAKLEDNPADFNDSFLSYIEYLPNYVTASLNDAKFRVLVEFKRSSDSGGSMEDYYTYGTMEVRK